MVGWLINPAKESDPAFRDTMFNKIGRSNTGGRKGIKFRNYYNGDITTEAIEYKRRDISVARGRRHVYVNLLYSPIVGVLFQGFGVRCMIKYALQKIRPATIHSWSQLSSLVGDDFNAGVTLVKMKPRGRKGSASSRRNHAVPLTLH